MKATKVTSEEREREKQNGNENLYLNYFSRGSTGLSYSLSLGAGSPHLMLFGATHGNEPAGAEALWGYYQYLVEQEITPQGTVTFAIGNPAAYAQNQRYIHQDLNRSFLEQRVVEESELRDQKSKEQKVQQQQNIEVQRVAELRTFFEAHQDIAGLLDLHSVSKGNSRMAVYDAENPTLSIFARKVTRMPIHFGYHPLHLRGTLMEEATKMGIESIGVECGNHNSPEAIRVALDQIGLFLYHYDVLKEHELMSVQSSLRYEEPRVYETIAAIRPGESFYFLDPRITSEQLLDKGERFAWDEDNFYHRAPRDCYVMMPSKHVKPTDSDAGFLCVRKEMKTRKIGGLGSGV